MQKTYNRQNCLKTRTKLEDRQHLDNFSTKTTRYSYRGEKLTLTPTWHYKKEINLRWIIKHKR